MRVTRTIRDFENALITLLEKNSFESLTVDQICKEALMHRSSFYRYFSDKYDLLEQTLNAQINKLTENTDSEDDIIKQLLSYIDKNKDVIRHLAPNSARSSLYTEILNILSQVLSFLLQSTLFFSEFTVDDIVIIVCLITIIFRHYEGS